ncbi:hypothetical protein BZ13_1593 [Francisella philomiragia subsp. philomiragia ATCC 25015]|uniref:hypothetical protein n=1 Tax=Francisella philomiragia TaxID=28110 RepID=UPI0001AF7938|nr:hypothetical protein [Francisella philomiragia]AJI74299.1 hypothetical protein BZ13_1593 [Francisella philomiragia subsp. philomiragia ATCC 25015]EET20223.1 conserved hypothetical protein [Francisella philomiragia subsp. philomiragia ATCC 25015]MBK2237267.1 hypothetical protein [Francisella philomiragia]
MLIKTIHLDKNFEATNPNEKDYELSIDTVLTELDREGVIGLFVELDSIYQYAFGKKLAKGTLQFERDFINLSTVHYRDININGFDKYFIDFEFLKSHLRFLLEVYAERVEYPQILAEAHSSLPFTIITEWNNQAYKLKKAIAELDITIANTFDNSKDIFNLLSYFSNRVS